MSNLALIQIREIVFSHASILKMKFHWIVLVVVDDDDGNSLINRTTKMKF